MKILTCVRPGAFEYSEQETPAIKEGQSLLKIKRIGICGTDLHAFEGTQPYFTYPRILGHELAAEFIEGDNAPGFIKGETVTFIPYFNCGHCIACRNGKPNCCMHLKVSGVHIDGGMAQYLSIPSPALVHGNGLSYDQLALVEPLAIGAHGVRRAAIKPGEFVLVVGAGPIGLGTMELARIAGGNVIALDVVESRLQFCRTQLHIPYSINAATTDVTEQLHLITHGDMPAVVIDCTGNLKAINHAFSYIAHGGRYILIGLQKENISFGHPEFHKREATLMSSRNATREDFDQVIIAMEKGWIQPATYITHRVPFSEVKAEFKKWVDPAEGVIKAMVEME